MTICILDSGVDPGKSVRSLTKLTRCCSSLACKTKATMNVLGSHYVMCKGNKFYNMQGALLQPGSADELAAQEPRVSR